MSKVPPPPINDKEKGIFLIEPLEKKAIASKDFVKKNTVFQEPQIMDFYDTFKLFADRGNRIEVQNLLQVAGTLGIDKKFKMVFRALQEIDDDNEGNPIDFETFIRALEERIGTLHTPEGREAVFNLLDQDKKNGVSFADLKEAAVQGKFHLTDEQLEEAMKKITPDDIITPEKFETFVAKKISKMK